MSDDQALLLRYTRSRDAEAFAQLVKRYSTLVFSIASRVTGNTAAAEDVTQDCFMKLACRAASIHGSLPAWLHRTALNRSMQVARNEARRQKHEDQISRPSDADYEHSWNQISPFVDAALAKLPDDLREPLVQHFLLDRTQTQVAENLHLDQGTVSRRLQAGIEKLRAHLKQAGVICTPVVLSAVLVKNASAAVPVRLSASLMKMAMAGPTAISTTATISAIMIAKAKLIGIVAAAVAVVTASVAIPLIVMEVKNANEPVTAESLQKDLVLHFTFDKAEPGGKVTDASGRGNQGKASGVRWTADGKKGGAYEFNADGDQIVVANNESLNPKQLTLAAWIKTTCQDDKWRRIFDKSYSKGYALSIAGDWQKKSWRGLACMEIAPGPHVSYSNNVVADGQWHHLAMTFDGTKQLMYVDGVAQDKPALWKKPGELGSTDFDLVIGCNRSNIGEFDLGISFRGAIDEPMMWNRALSTDEIKFLFDSQQ
jgi:RNA polymerase sigma factor (sigma-70 family)